MHLADTPGGPQQRLSGLHGIGEGGSEDSPETTPVVVAVGAVTFVL